MTTNEYIDAISRDLQDLITALDRDPHTSALVKGRAKGIQERINHYYNSIFEAEELRRQYLQFCDGCTKAYDFTCSGADAEKCNKRKEELLNRRLWR